MSKDGRCGMSLPLEMWISSWGQVSSCTDVSHWTGPMFSLKMGKSTTSDKVFEKYSWIQIHCFGYSLHSWSPRSICVTMKTLLHNIIAENKTSCCIMKVKFWLESGTIFLLNRNYIHIALKKSDVNPLSAKFTVYRSDISDLGTFNLLISSLLLPPTWAPWVRWWGHKVC